MAEHVLILDTDRQLLLLLVCCVSNSEYRKIISSKFKASVGRDLHQT